MAVEAQLSLAGGALFYLVPRDGRGGGRLFFRAQGVDADGGFVLVVLAPVDQHFAAAQALQHLGNDEVGVLAAPGVGPAPVAQGKSPARSSAARGSPPS